MKNYGDLCKKFSSRRGAAMLIALLVFFLAALAGTVVLTMATSNAGRYTHEKDDQQAYLSVASAGKLILNKLESISVEYKTAKNPAQANVTEDDIDITYYGPDYTIDAPGTATSAANAGLFLSDKRFQDMLKTFSLNRSVATDTISFILTVPTAAEMGQVYVSLVLEGATFSFRLYSMRGESRDYQITMRVETAFDKDGAGNFVQREVDKQYYRVLTFDTASATFAVEKLTGGAE